MSPRPLIVDCDPGQDDAVALLLAFAAREEFDILGITAVAGNVPLALTESNARRIRDLVGRPEVPVYAGCPRPMVRKPVTAERIHGATGLDGAGLPEPVHPVGQAHAVDFLVETLLAAPEPVTLATLGPLTNVALAIVKNPAILANLREVVTMGGAAGAGNVTASAEFNIFADPHAAHVVFEAGAPLIMIGLDVTHQAIATPPRLEAIRALGTAPAAAVCGMLDVYSAKTMAAYCHGAPLHDPCVIAYLLQPDLFAGREIRVDIDIGSGPCFGRTVCDWRGRSGKPANARVLESINADGFFALLTDHLARLPAGSA
ncbi:MAG: nucleoside hydrolase [Alphaproteobacteria bacterium]|nr:nucleoside hydrolase [Alphaproteobacteria bacterium]